VTVNCPLHEGTRGLVNAELLKHFKKGAWLVNTARGAICDKDAVADALKSGQLSGYSGKNTRFPRQGVLKKRRKFY
jgi:formate dehydrogenase